MKGPLGNIMQQAQAMQENFKKAQEELAQIEVTGTSGGGLVEVVMTCRHDVRRIKIDDSLISDDKEGRVYRVTYSRPLSEGVESTDDDLQEP